MDSWLTRMSEEGKDKRIIHTTFVGGKRGKVYETALQLTTNDISFCIEQKQKSVN